MIRCLIVLTLVVACLTTNPARPPVRLSAGSEELSLVFPTGEMNASADRSSTNPLALLEESARRYSQEYRGFRATLHKQERLDAVLHPPEVVQMSLRESPYAVRFLWKEGARAPMLAGVSLGKVEGVLYAAGENRGQMLIWRPSAFFSKLMPIDPLGDSARCAARYSATEASLGQVARRTWRAWEAARRRGESPAQYLGVRSIPEVGGQLCHVLHRVCAEPEYDNFLSTEPRRIAPPQARDAFTEVTVYLDIGTGLQVGSEQKNAQGEVVGRYFFTAIEKNPQFAADEFRPNSLRKE
jgi:hypothetical protein